MRRRWIIAAIVAQFAVLAWMAGEREWVVRTGETVLLRTAPVDPRDPMRGDYVRFNYEASFVPWAQCRDGVLAWRGRDWSEQRRIKDRRVYALLRLDTARVGELVALSDRTPDSGTFLRGRVASISERGIEVRFGIEAMFTEQGKARRLETAPQVQAGVPLNIETAVSPGGLAVLKGYRWEPLGLTVEVRRQPLSEASRRTVADNEDRRRTLENMQPPIGALVTLKNHSERPVALVVRPGGGSFRLIADERNSHAAWRPMALPASGANAGPLTPDMVKLLQPGETYREELDFTRAEWHVVAVEGKRAKVTLPGPVAWTDLPENERWDSLLRLEYQPPSPEATEGLPHRDLIHFSALRSRAIRGSDGLD